MREDKPDPIAIVGHAIRFPGAEDVATFWTNLLGGIESIRFLTEAELLAGGEDPERIRRSNYVPAKGLLAGCDLFDAEFFGFPDREAGATDPQQRLLLETAWRALEDAGYQPGPQPSIGLFAGARANRYAALLAASGELTAGAAGDLPLRVGCDPDFFATRISYQLNLRGPSLTVQSACSSSLLAVHLACRALQAGDCDIALAGGVSVQVPPQRGYLCEPGMTESADGHCRVFDDAATGTVGGDGVGVVVLRRLSEAMRDRDEIRAVILGSAVNNDGNDKLGFTAPSVRGQVDVLRAALRDAGVEPDSVDYVECHGTGTRLGDPLELRAVREVYGRARTTAPCAVGSVKSNIGHLDAAAGVAGLVKATLAVRHGIIPPTLHARTPNRVFDWTHSGLRIATDASLWQGDRLRRAGVTALGIGGTNVHLVLEEPPRVPEPVSSGWQALTLSARSAAALTQAARDLADVLRRPDPPRLADVARVLQTGRRLFPYRRAVVCRDGTAAVEQLMSSGQPPEYGVAAGEAAPAVLLFPGQGVEIVGVGRELYGPDAAFTQALDEVAELSRTHGGVDPRQVLWPDTGSPGRKPGPDSAQIGLFALEYALAAMVRHAGIVPAAVLGHSTGEVAAACVAGVLTLPDAVRLVLTRGWACAALCPAGEMLAVGLAEESLTPLAAEHGCVVSVVNAPTQCLVSGRPEDIDRLGTRLAAARVATRPLRTGRAYHSVLMAPAADALTGALREIELRRPKVPLLSATTGRWLDEEVTRADYWATQLVGPVRFAEALSALLTEHRRCLDVGPGRTLYRTGAGRAAPCQPAGHGGGTARRPARRGSRGGNPGPGGALDRRGRRGMAGAHRHGPEGRPARPPLPAQFLLAPAGGGTGTGGPGRNGPHGAERRRRRGTRPPSGPGRRRHRPTATPAGDVRIRPGRVPGHRGGGVRRGAGRRSGGLGGELLRARR